MTNIMLSAEKPETFQTLQTAFSTYLNKDTKPADRQAARKQALDFVNSLSRSQMVELQKYYDKNSTFRENWDNFFPKNKGAETSLPSRLLNKGEGHENVIKIIGYRECEADFFYNIAEIPKAMVSFEMIEAIENYFKRELGENFAKPFEDFKRRHGSEAGNPPQTSENLGEEGQYPENSEEAMLVNARKRIMDTGNRENRILYADITYYPDMLATISASTGRTISDVSLDLFQNVFCVSTYKAYEEARERALRDPTPRNIESAAHASQIFLFDAILFATMFLGPQSGAFRGGRLLARADAIAGKAEGFALDRAAYARVSAAYEKVGEKAASDQLARELRLAGAPSRLAKNTANETIRQYVSTTGAFFRESRILNAEIPKLGVRPLSFIRPVKDYLYSTPILRNVYYKTTISKAKSMVLGEFAAIPESEAKRNAMRACAKGDWTAMEEAVAGLSQVHDLSPLTRAWSLERSLLQEFNSVRMGNPLQALNPFRSPAAEMKSFYERLVIESNTPAFGFSGGFQIRLDRARLAAAGMAQSGDVTQALKTIDQAVREGGAQALKDLEAIKQGSKQVQKLASDLGNKASDIRKRKGITDEFANGLNSLIYSGDEGQFQRLSLLMGGEDEARRRLGRLLDLHNIKPTRAVMSDLIGYWKTAEKLKDAHFVVAGAETRLSRLIDASSSAVDFVLSKIPARLKKTTAVSTATRPYEEMASAWRAWRSSAKEFANATGTSPPFGRLSPSAEGFAGAAATKKYLENRAAAWQSVGHLFWENKVPLKGGLAPLELGLAASTALPLGWGLLAGFGTVSRVPLALSVPYALSYTPGASLKILMDAVALNPLSQSELGGLFGPRLPAPEDSSAQRSREANADSLAAELQAQQVKADLVSIQLELGRNLTTEESETLEKGMKQGLTSPGTINPGFKKFDTQEDRDTYLQTQLENIRKKLK